MNTEFKIKKPHVQSMREMFAENASFISDLMKWSDYEYKDAMFESGMRFLESRFPPRSKEYGVWYEAYKSDRDFWNWWRNEWGMFINPIVINIRLNRLKMNAKLMHEMIQMFIADNALDTSFSNFYLPSCEILVGSEVVSGKS